MSQANGKLQIAIREAVGDIRTMNRQTDRRLWCHCGSFLLTCLMHSSLSLVCCMCLSIEGIEFILTAVLSLYLEAIQVLLSEKWTDKKRCVSGWEKNGGEHFSANLWSPHTLNKALKDTERSDDISVVGEDEPSHPSFMLTKSLQCNSDTPLSFLQVQLWSSKNASKINSTTQ